MDEKQCIMWDMLCELDGETVARLFTNYHGNQLLDDGFYENLQDEGYLEEDDEDEECTEEWTVTLNCENEDGEDEFNSEDEDEAQEFFEDNKENVRQFFKKTYNSDLEETDCELIYSNI